ncbi:hypothetical protein AAMO2058_001340000 [Amorphochlora amoebiformis]
MTIDLSAKFQSNLVHFSRIWTGKNLKRSKRATISKKNHKRKHMTHKLIKHQDAKKENGAGWDNTGAEIRIYADRARKRSGNSIIQFEEQIRRECQADEDGMKKRLNQIRQMDELRSNRNDIKRFRRSAHILLTDKTWG